MIYFLRAGSHGPVKIGRTKDAITLRQRVATLQTAQAHRLVILRTIEGGRAEEFWLHGFFSGARMAGEWFDFQQTMLEIIPPDNLILAIGSTIQLRLSDQGLADLDAYCAAQRRKTGENVSRNGVIREAIQRMLSDKVVQPDKRSDKAA